MTYYIHADKFFLENRTENGGYLEVQDDGKFGFFYPETKKPEEKSSTTKVSGLHQD